MTVVHRAARIKPTTLQSWDRGVGQTCQRLQHKTRLRAAEAAKRNQRGRERETAVAWSAPAQAPEHVMERRTRVGPDEMTETGWHAKGTAYRGRTWDARKGSTVASTAALLKCKVGVELEQ